MIFSEAQKGRGKKGWGRGRIAHTSSWAAAGEFLRLSLKGKRTENVGEKERDLDTSTTTPLAKI